MGCTEQKKVDLIEMSKAEILDTEAQFLEMVNQKGLKEGFVYFAAEDATIRRGGKLIHGKDSIVQFYKEQNLDNVTLSWKPDFVQVAESGDLGYTYGKYKYSETDSLGMTNVSDGIFQTIWKKQKNGKWKYAWD